MSAPQRRKEGDFRLSELANWWAEHSQGIELTDLSARTIETPLFSGIILSQEVQPGLTIAASDLTHLTAQIIEGSAEPAVECGVLLHGNEQPMEVEGYGAIARTLARPAVKGSGRPIRFRAPSMPSSRISGAGFILKPDFFDRFGDSINDDGLAPLRSFATGDFRFELLPRSPRIVEIARQCLDHPYNGHLGELFLEGNALAFVVEIAEMLAHKSRLVALIGKRHYDRIMEARDILDANLAKPPKTLELTKLVGVNLTTLHANFKTVFGTTIFGYVRAQRLEMARMLLIEHHLTVAEAGYRVGFASPSAFAVAYRRHFGNPPSNDARRGQC